MNSPTSQVVSSVRHNSSHSWPKKLSALALCSTTMLSLWVLSACTSFNRNLSDEQKCDRIEQLSEGYSSNFPQVAQITTEQLLAEQMKGNLLIVDVRESAEQQVSMIPEAITSSQFEQEAQRYKNTAIVTYCTVGYRSGIYAKDLQAKGYSVYSLKGGILSWVHAGQTVADSAGPTRRVHVCGPKWNLLPRGYEAVWEGVLQDCTECGRTIR